MSDLTKRSPPADAGKIGIQPKTRRPERLVPPRPAPRPDLPDQPGIARTPPPGPPNPLPNAPLLPRPATSRWGYAVAVALLGTMLAFAAAVIAIVLFDVLVP